MRGIRAVNVVSAFPQNDAVVQDGKLPFKEAAGHRYVAVARCLVEARHGKRDLLRGLAEAEVGDGGVAVDGYCDRGVPHRDIKDPEFIFAGARCDGAGFALGDEEG